MYNKYENMVIVRSRYLYSLYPRKPGLSENYAFFDQKRSKATMQKLYFLLELVVIINES